MIDKVIDFVGDIGMDIIKSTLQETHDLRKIRNDIINFVEGRHELFLEYDSDYNEIDYQGYLNYVRQDMLNEIKRYICTVDYKEAKDLKQTILAKALAYERKFCYQNGCILYITENCINIIKKYYEGKLDGNDQLLAHITVQTILETAVPKLDTMQEGLNQIKDILLEQGKNRKEESSSLHNKVTEIGNLLANDGKKMAKENANGICLAYCESDVAYADELKRWFVSNSVSFNECCYIDEYSENEDAVSYLKKNNILILLVGESFLRNVHCVYGLAEATKNENAVEYIFPIVVERSIFSERNRIERIAYWETKENELRTSVEKLEKVQHAHKLVSENLVRYEKTAQSIDEFIAWILKHSYSVSKIGEIIKKKVLTS